MIEILVRDTETGNEVIATVVDFNFRPDSNPFSGSFLKLDIETAICDLEWINYNEQNRGQTTSEV